MRSASDRFPRESTLLTTWVTSTEWYTGSGVSSRRGAGPFLGTLSPPSWPRTATGLAGTCRPDGSAWALRDTTLTGRLFRHREEAGLVLADAGRGVAVAVARADVGEPGGQVLVCVGRVVR